MSAQTVKFARIRASIDPDRSPESVGTYFGANFYRYALWTYHPRTSHVTSHGATVAPGLHPNKINANRIVSGQGVTGFAARRLLTACLP